MEEDVEVSSWLKCNIEDLWIFDKLILAKKLGYVCGPAGVSVPNPDNYIVRPVINIPGMGRGAQILWIDNDTDHLPSGHFWCEIFNGDHISIDYVDNLPALAVQGFRDNPNDPLYKFSKWQKIDSRITIPPILHTLKGKYKHINVEYIGGKVIEIHLRHNPDFIWNNTVVYPVWQDQDPDDIQNQLDNKQLKFVHADAWISGPTVSRKGFLID